MLSEKGSRRAPSPGNRPRSGRSNSRSTSTAGPGVRQRIADRAVCRAGDTKARRTVVRPIVTEVRVSEVVDSAETGWSDPRLVLRRVVRPALGFVPQMDASRDLAELIRDAMASHAVVCGQ